jgi:glycosyltransferase involved in cell wall biosynthesis
LERRSLLKLTIPVESRFSRASDGHIYTGGPFTYDFYSRYLAAFDEVEILARVKDVVDVPHDHARVDGPRVRIVSLPYFVGLRGFLGKSAPYWRIVRQHVQESDAVLLRLPGLAGLTARLAMRSGQTYGVELVGDPDEVFGPNGVESWLAPLLRVVFTSATRRATAGATCVSYVTAAALQAKYPAATSAFTTHYSSVELSNESFGSIRKYPRGGRLRCVTVGSMEQNYKGIDTAITAIGRARELGCDATLTVVGEGRLMDALKTKAVELGIAQHVTFLGQVPSGSGVRSVLRRSDVFILASRSEGLPRAMIEAMATGLPALGTRVGGIPELLPVDSLVAVDDAESLAGKLRQMAASEERYRGLSEASINRAAEYRADILRNRRNMMYLTLRSRAEGMDGLCHITEG